MDLSIPLNEHGLIRVFAVNRPANPKAKQH